ncbi:nuclear transport factor 2 family protein [Actinophytocola sp. NPDC049390]|uniref:nuclear transport factor 2 family protein n=1 Tax=Actinophytocola sp. NPDC049390 TaxID=3363894 RepID=UPI0037A8CC86
MGENAVRRYYELVDQGDVDGLVALFDPEAVYHRPGYPPLCGKEELLRFYSSQRVIKEGKHTVGTLVANGAEVAVHGEFHGTLHSGETVEARFADFFRCHPDGTFARRDTFFFVPLI